MVKTLKGGLSFFDGVLGVPIRTPKIPQVDTTGMTSTEKVTISSVNRLHPEPTEVEKKYFSVMSG